MSSYVFDKPAVCGQYPAIGGGAPYEPDRFATYHDRSDWPTGGHVTRSDADEIVASASDIPDDVPPGATVWVESDAVIDAGARQFKTFTERNVTLASGRGQNGSPGALIRTNNRTSHQFTVAGEGCRVVGIRFRGPEPNSFGSKPYPASEALSIDGDNVEVDNCVFRGWTHAGIEVGRNSPASPFVHHCDFVDNNSEGLGYGLTVFHGHPVIQACYADNNRHSFAGDGAHDAGWTILDCIWGEHHRLHAGDQHEDRTSDGDAGRRMVMRRNICLSTHNWKSRDGPTNWGQETVSIRAIPREKLVVTNNVFRNSKPIEPMRDHRNAAFNVWYADTFAEGRVEGVDQNVYSWQAGDPIPQEMGPTRKTAVTGHGDGVTGGTGGETGGTGTGGSGDDTKLGPPMSYPTSDRGETEQYDVELVGTGNVSQYVLTAKTGVRFPGDEEKQDRIEGRTAFGQLSTLSDIVECTGPITALRVTSGPEVEVKIDGQTYWTSDFPDTEREPAGGTLSGTLTVGGQTFDVAFEMNEK